MIKTPETGTPLLLTPASPAVKTDLESLKDQFGDQTGTVLWEKIYSLPDAQKNLLVQNFNLLVDNRKLITENTDLALQTRLQKLGRDIVSKIDERRSKRQLAMLQTEIDELRSELKDATTDEVTGMPGAKAVYKALREAVEQKTKNPDLKISVLLIDADGLKGINEKFGHPGGNALLHAIGTNLKGGMRKQRGVYPADFVGRMGGDEYVAVFYDLSEEHHPDVQKRTQENLAKGVVILTDEKGNTHSLALLASGGMQEIQPGQTVDEIIYLADVKAFENKAARKAAGISVERGALPPSKNSEPTGDLVELAGVVNQPYPTI